MCLARLSFNLQSCLNHILHLSQLKRNFDKK